MNKITLKEKYPEAYKDIMIEKSEYKTNFYVVLTYIDEIVHQTQDINWLLQFAEERQNMTDNIISQLGLEDVDNVEKISNIQVEEFKRLIAIAKLQQ